MNGAAIYFLISLVWLISVALWGGIRYAKGEFENNTGSSYYSLSSGFDRLMKHIVVIGVVGTLLWPLSIVVGLGMYIGKKK